MAFTAAQIVKQEQLFEQQLDDIMTRWKQNKLLPGVKCYLAIACEQTHVTSVLGGALGWMARCKNAVMQPWRLEALTSEGVVYLMSSNPKDKLFEPVKDDEYVSMYDS